jgi:hypothetical protein
MKIAKIIAVLLIAYVSIVVTFESLLGVFQPENQRTLVITTADASGTKNDRVLSQLDSNGKIYVAANHWPRAWYKRALINPNVEAMIDEKKTSYRVVPLDEEEQSLVNEENQLGLGLRILTGFPPRYIVRLDPQ